MGLYATIEERQLADRLCEVGGMTPQQAPGLALIIAAYREQLLKVFDEQVEQLAAEAEKSPPQEAAAYYVCLDRLRTVLLAARGER